MEEMLSEIPDVTRSIGEDELVLDEVHQHWLIARNLTGCYVEREQVLDLVRSYAVSNEDKALVIFGEPGTGKSTVLAKAAAEVCMGHRVTSVARKKIPARGVKFRGLALKLFPTILGFYNSKSFIGGGFEPTPCLHLA